MKNNQKHHSLAERFARLSMLIQVSALVAGGRGLRSNARGTVKIDHVGYGVAVAGGIAALIAFMGAVFIPVTTVALVWWEAIAVIGLILLIVGVLVHAAGPD